MFSGRFTTWGVFGDVGGIVWHCVCGFLRALLQAYFTAEAFMAMCGRLRCEGKAGKKTVPAGMSRWLAIWNASNTL